MACKRWKNVGPETITDLETTYSVFVDGSITGVPVTPTSGVMSPYPSPTRWPEGPEGTEVSPVVPPCAESIRLTCHSCTHGEASASKAYRLSCCVAANTTLCCAPLIVRLATHSGCA